MAALPLKAPAQDRAAWVLVRAARRAIAARAPSRSAVRVARLQPSFSSGVSTMRSTSARIASVTSRLRYGSLRPSTSARAGPAVDLGHIRVEAEEIGGRGGGELGFKLLTPSVQVVHLGLQL